MSNVNQGNRGPVNPPVSTTIPVLDPSVIATVAAIVSQDKNTSAPAEANPLLGALNRLIANAEQESLERKAAKDEVLAKNLAEIEKIKVMRRNNLRSLDQRNAELYQFQHYGCTHKQPPPTNATNLGGWFLISGNLHLTCQECGREWKGAQTDPEIMWVNQHGLMPPAKYLGNRPIPE